MAKFWSIIAILGVLAASFAFLKSSPSSTTVQSMANEAPLRPVNPSGFGARGNDTNDDAVVSARTDDDAPATLDELLAIDDDSDDDFSTPVVPEGHVNTGMPHATGGGETPWESLAREFQIDLDKAMGDDDQDPGSGTEDDPRRLSWDLLMAASETFKPRDGQEDLPDNILSLDDQIVRLSGYYLLPMAGDEFDEVLMMRNMWDGCCIGVPPSAFSAVLVKLDEPIRRGKMWAMNVGTVEGRMVIDPIVDRGWILSLYVIEEGGLETEG